MDGGLGCDEVEWTVGLGRVQALELWRVGDEAWDVGEVFGRTVGWDWSLVVTVWVSATAVRECPEEITLSLLVG